MTGAKDGPKAQWLPQHQNILHSPPFRLYFELLCTYFYVIPVIMISKVALSAMTSSYQMNFSISHFSFQKKKKKKIHSVDLLGEDPIEFPIQISLYFCLRVILGHLWVIFWVMYQNFTSWNN